MSGYILSCCSTADLTEKYFQKRDIQYVCFHFELGEQRYSDDLGESVYPEELYRRMLAGERTRTIPVSVKEYEEFFEKNLKEGKDILHVTLSSGISDAYTHACAARDRLAQKYPDRKLYIVDSLGASSGYGLLMDMLADLRDAGMGIDELYHWAENHKLNIQHWFFSTDLTFYIRGGRISKAEGIVGSMLDICPLMDVNIQGQLRPREKISGKKKVIKRIVEQMEVYAQDGKNYSGKCFLCHSVCREDARAVANLVEKTFQKLDGKVNIFPVGATIGSHTGPGTIALFFYGETRAH
jgi:DegV family protein with EDD domain